MEKQPSNFERRIIAALQPLIKLLARWGVHPNVLTTFGLLAGIVTFYFIIRGSFAWASVMIFLVGLFDVLDGELARFSGRTSRYGAIFDSTADRYVEAFIYTGCLVFFWEVSLLAEFFIIVALTGSLLVSYIKAAAGSQGIECPVGLLQRKARLLILFFGTVMAAIPYTGPIFLGAAIATVALLSHYTAIQRLRYVREQINKQGK